MGIAAIGNKKMFIKFQHLPVGMNKGLFNKGRSSIVKLPAPLVHPAKGCGKLVLKTAWNTCNT